MLNPVHPLVEKQRYCNVTRRISLHAKLRPSLKLTLQCQTGCRLSRQLIERKKPTYNAHYSARSDVGNVVVLELSRVCLFKLPNLIENYWGLPRVDAVHWLARRGGSRVLCVGMCECKQIVRAGIQRVT